MPHHVAHFVTGEPSFLYVAVITASTKLSSEIFTVRHSPCAVSLVGLVSLGENGNIIIVMNNNNMNMKIDTKILGH